ncbi:MAG: Calx-beta domain-containing protein, partial [Gammaproteobacteria bacterium]
MMKSIAKSTVAALCLSASLYSYADSLQFSAPSYTVEEGGATATITVTRVYSDSWTEYWTVGADYTTIDGSATAGSDYLSVSGSLTFAAGVTSQTFTIPIIDDGDYEGDEILNLALSNPTGGATLGSQETAVLTIAEDEVPPVGSLQFSAPSYTVNENDAEAVITVTRVNGSFGTVAVDYNTGDGTASAGSDYEAESGTLIFDEGVTSQTFTINIFDDAAYEGDETVNLSLSNPLGGAGLESPTTAILTIAEDDPVPPAGSLQFSTPTYT